MGITSLHQECSQMGQELCRVSLEESQTSKNGSPSCLAEFEICLEGPQTDRKSLKFLRTVSNVSGSMSKSSG